MRRLIRSTLLTCAVIGAAAAPAIADPILINGGYLEMGLPTSTTGTVVLAGDRGFTLNANLSVFDSRFDPWTQCLICPPGSPISLAATFVGTSLRSSTATLDGLTFTNVGGLPSPNQAALNFTGSTNAPALGGEVATVMSPFFFEGSFFSSAFINPDGTGIINESLLGLGTATLSLRANTVVPGTWSFASARYDFAPIPEPGTILLGASGLALVASRVRRKRRQTHSCA